MTVSVKILGPGCGNCHNLEANARAAAKQLGVDATFEFVTDRTLYPGYGLLYTPGLVVNEKLVSGGRVAAVSEIVTLLANVL